MSNWKPGCGLGSFLRTMDTMREVQIEMGRRAAAKRYERRLTLNTCPTCDRAGCRSHKASVSWLDFKGWYYRQPRQAALREAPQQEAA